jgi:PAS domain S-box-containing protein
MKKRFELPENPDELRAKIIGFGERSGRKSYYPELREREERLRAVFEGAAIGIGVIDPEGCLQDANRELQELLGQSEVELRGRQYLSLVHPDDRARFGEKQAQLLRGATDRVSVEVRLVRTDGETIWVQVRASVVKEDDGAPAYIVAATQDITLRKRAREALEFLSRASVRLATSLDVGGTLQNLAELAVPFLGDFFAISVCTSDGGREHRLLACADAAQKPLAERLLAGRSLAQTAGTSTSGPPRLLRDARAQLVAAEADPARRELLRWLDFRSLLAIPLESDGSRGTLLLATAGSGRLYGTFDLELATEFAHRAALALENASLLLRAQEASRLKDEFLAVVSHELRTPLTSILGWMHLIQTKELASADARRGLSVVERNARALAHIIDDLLGISHIMAGRLDVHLAPMALAPVVENAIEALVPSAGANGVAIHLECEPAVPPVMGDAKRLQQVVWNLVSNAVKYTPEGGEVRVRLARAGASAELTVSDTGRGISPEFLPHVFELFRQEDSSATRCFGGLGLGLAIVRHLVALHGGTVRATSRGEGQGTCFTMTLPVVVVQGAGAAPPAGGELTEVHGLLEEEDDPDALAVDEHEERERHDPVEEARVI